MTTTKHEETSGGAASAFEGTPDSPRGGAGGAPLRTKERRALRWSSIAGASLLAITGLAATLIPSRWTGEMGPDAAHADAGVPVADAVAGVGVTSSAGASVPAMRSAVAAAAGEGVLVRLHGAVVSRGQRVLAFESAGIVREVLVNPGDDVAAGQVIARLDTGSVRNARRASERRSDELASSLRQVERDRERTVTLLATGAAPPRQLEELEARREGLLAALEGLEVERDELQRRARESVLRAPAAGRVIDVLAREGTFAGPGTPIVALRDADAWVVEVGVPESWLAGVAPGQAVEVVLPAGAAPLRLPGRVVSYVDGGAPGRLPQAQVAFAAPIGDADGAIGLRSGQIAVVEVTGPREGVLVPVASLSRVPVDAVWTLRTGRAHAVAVRVLGLEDGHARVAGAISPGEIVLHGRVDRLEDGAPVEVAQATAGEVAR